MAATSALKANGYEYNLLQIFSVVILIKSIQKSKAVSKDISK